MPPPGLIPESLVRDILSLIKKEYPWAESILASKMTKEQFRLFVDNMPELKAIITSRMPVVHQSGSVLMPGSPKLAMLKEAAAAAVAAAEKAGLEKDKKKQQQQHLNHQRKVSMRFVELLYQIRKVTELGLLDETILNEPLSPMTMSMINSMVTHIKVRSLGTPLIREDDE